MPRKLSRTLNVERVAAYLRYGDSTIVGRIGDVLAAKLRGRGFGIDPDAIEAATIPPAEGPAPFQFNIRDVYHWLDAVTKDDVKAIDVAKVLYSICKARRKTKA